MSRFEIYNLFKHNEIMKRQFLLKLLLFRLSFAKTHYRIDINFQ